MVDNSALNSIVKEALDQPTNVFVTASGVRLRLKRVPSSILLRVDEKIPVPQPPRHYIEEKDIWVENASDPEYEKELEKYLREKGELSFQIYLGMGTELDGVPENMERPESDNWIEELQDTDVFGDYTVEVRRSGKARYVDWLRYYALGDSDINKCIKAVQRYSGVVFQEDVLSAAESFRDSEGQHANSGDESTEQSE